MRSAIERELPAIMKRSKAESELLELMRADRQIMNQRQISQDPGKAERKRQDRQRRAARLAEEGAS
jgi:hypothetical protein